MNPSYTFALEELAYLWALCGRPHTAHLLLRTEMGEQVLQRSLLEQRLTVAGHSLLARGLLEQTPTKDGMQPLPALRDLFAQIVDAPLFFQYARPTTAGALYLTNGNVIVQESRHQVVYDFWVYPRAEAILRLAERLGLPAPEGGELPAPAAQVTPALFARVLEQAGVSPTDAAVNLVAAGFESSSARALVRALSDAGKRGEVTLLSTAGGDTAALQLSGWRFVRDTEVLWWFPIGRPDQVLPAYQLTPAQSADLLATWFAQVEQILAQLGRATAGESSPPIVKQGTTDSDKVEGVA
ncbi:MAG: hypothetical protein NZM11_03130 [Anaerolineales bacterium]|nr:hypothetical protein [Anaerolineales bacterium]